MLQTHLARSRLGRALPPRDQRASLRIAEAIDAATTTRPATDARAPRVPAARTTSRRGGTAHARARTVSCCRSRTSGSSRVEQFGAGPWATLQLADLGAEVIKIEDPTVGGDVGRYVPPFQEGEDSLFFETFNRNKKSVSLDLRHPDGRGVFEDLVARLATSSTRTCAATSRAKLGLTYDAAEGRQPADRLLLALRLRDDRARAPREGGYDYMMQGLAGWMSLTGEPGRAADEERALARRPLGRLRVGDRDDGRPLARAPRRRRLRLRRLAVRDGAARADVRRHLGGDPRLRAAAAAQLGAPVDRAVPELPDRGRLDRRRRRRSRSSGSGSARRSGGPSSPSDPRFADFAGARPTTATSCADARRGVPRAHRGRVARRCSSRPACRARRVNDVAEALADPQTLAREGVVEYEHPTLGTVRQIATPLRLADGAERLERARRRARRSAASTPSRCWSSCAATRRARGELAPAGVFGTSVTARDLVGYGRHRPTRAGPAARASRSASSSTTRRAASRRRSRATRPRRRFCTRSSARRRPSAGATSTPSRCSSSAAVPASGACTGSSPRTACR